jgi:hypothetical protein
MRAMTSLLDSSDPAIFTLATHTPGPSGALPLTEDLLRHSASGYFFGWTQNVGICW